MSQETIAALRDGMVNKNAAISLVGREATLGSNTYYVYAIYVLSAGSNDWQTVYVTPAYEYGYGEHWVNMATEKIAELTGVPIDTAYITRWGRENGVAVTANMQTVHGEAALNDFIAAPN